MHLGGGSINISLSIDRLNDDDKNNVMWVLEKFGRQVPDLKRYPFLSKSYLDPYEDLKQKHSLENQKDWDKAWEWYDAYKSGVIPFLEYRIQIREKELEKDESKLKQIKSREKLSRDAKYLLKAYERDIPEQKAEIAKLKSELESLKAKEAQKQQEKQPNLSLENENLRLKKEILEMELKLTEANRERQKMEQTITLAAGCFWGTQAYFSSQPGVLKTTVGYANGNQKTVTYDEICQNETGFVEACQITFNDKVISLSQLLIKYWQVIDPTLINQQGNDVGTQYRTGIYYMLTDELWILPIIIKSRDEIAINYNKPIVTEIKPLSLYLLAEEYHQNYLEKNPNGYCHIKLPKYKK